MIKPVRPLKPPVKNPKNPSYLAPFIGYFMTPVSPRDKPFIIILPLPTNPPPK
jgi:hypothetical protein